MRARVGFMVGIAAVGLLAASPVTALAQKRQRDVITQEEIEKSGQLDRDLLSAIRNLRPHFLAPPRGVRTMGNGMTYPLVVYVDGSKQSGVDVLVTMMAKDVKEVRYLEPAESTNRYGTTANGGAIVIKTLTASSKQG